MMELAEYCLTGAVIVAGLALLLNIGAVTSKKRALERAEAATSRELVGSGGPTVGGLPAPDYADYGVTPQADTARTGSHGLAWYGTAFTVMSLLLLTAYIGIRMSVTGHGPFSNQHEFAVAFAWGILLAYLVFEWLYRLRALSLAVLPVSLGMMVYAMNLDATVNPLVPALQNSVMLTLHVGFAVISYGTACVSFAAAVLWLVRPKVKARWLPGQDTLDDIGYRAAALTFPLITIMIVLGAIWADTAWGRYWGWDPKETAAFVTWLIYGGYLHARVVRNWRGKKAAWLLVIGFAMVLFAYFGNHFFGGLHSYG
ncbi:c-type cytochrome biogenesis protein CcsB [Tessaracoccus sp. Y36]